MEDVFDVLVEDHEEIRKALAELEKGPTAATGATEDQLMLRKIMTEELILEEAKHEEIELTCIWPAVRGQIPAGDQLADRAVCAELEIVGLLAELDKLDVCQPEFEQLLGAFTQAARRAPPWLWAMPLFYALTILFINVETPRFREPIDPFLVLLAACAVAHAAGYLRSRIRLSASRPATL